jgi:hypothetical protein
VTRKLVVVRKAGMNLESDRLLVSYLERDLILVVLIAPTERPEQSHEASEVSPLADGGTRFRTTHVEPFIWNQGRSVKSIDRGPQPVRARASISSGQARSVTGSRAGVS